MALRMGQVDVDMSTTLGYTEKNVRIVEVSPNHNRK